MSYWQHEFLVLFHQMYRENFGSFQICQLNIHIFIHQPFIMLYLSTVTFILVALVGKYVYI